MVTPGGRDFEAALDELSRLRDIVEGYKGHCAEVAQGVYSSVAQQIASLNAAAEDPLPLAPAFGVAGVASCNLPAAGDPLAAYTRFFLEPSRVQVASVNAPQIYGELAGLAQLGQDDVLVDSVYVLIDTEPGSKLDAVDKVVHAGDTLHLQMVDSLRVQSVDSLSVVARLRRGPGRWPLEWSMELAGVVGYPEHDRPLDWLQTTGWAGWVETRGARVVLFPHLQPFWEEVRTLTPSEAIRHLQARADAQRGNVEVLAWGGPLVVLAIMLYLFAQLGHLKGIAARDQAAIRDYPWIGLFDDRLSVSLVLASIVALPATANAALAVRLSSTSLVGAIWPGVAALACAAIGLMTYRRLRDLRRSLGSAGEPRGPSRPPSPGPDEEGPADEADAAGPL